ncbi:mannonate dehydratase [uncultured Cohaesibacter sp.]|uniref:mannonate dehydratase n=1 Tax=uncultured Cohaesibacter sp. TaxID=1002546 RepID=UPI002AA8643A|nr:mannonate dehydratase [uncultured Cohaesibacter sp.]
MREGWRWYGSFDRISLAEIAQTGASEIVSALYDVPYGEVWPRESIAKMRKSIALAGFRWSVVESLPIHERIKKGEGDLSQLFANYRQSMANLAAEGVKVICYNFMPLLDWTRTDLKAPVDGGGTCLRFDAARMAALEVYMLERAGAEADYCEDALERGRVWFSLSDEAKRQRLMASVMAGLPGAYDRYTIKQLKEALKGYVGIDRHVLRSNYKRFLDEVIPAAEELGLRFAVHPDDPPRNILGLPRIVSTQEDIAWVLSAHESRANGLTLCSGSLGAHPDNDIPAIAKRFADKIHFAHLRNVRKFADGSFEEAAHLGGDTDMALLVGHLLGEESWRREEGRADADIVFRPDHGHELLDDDHRDTHPGYPLIGRMRGLAELRGLMAGISYERATA